MADTTGIQWTDSTWNLVYGCTKVSEGCRGCYIEDTPPFRKQGLRFVPLVDGGDPGDPGAHIAIQLMPERLSWPYRRGARALGPRVFVNSLSDLYHPDVPDRFIASAMAVMADTPHLTYQVLTKRPARMRSLLNSVAFAELVADELQERGIATEAAYEPDNGEGRAMLTWRAPGVKWPVMRWWPLPNRWDGVTVEDRRAAAQRIPLLRDTVSALRFLSCEPLLEQLDNLASLLVDVEQCRTCGGSMSVPVRGGGTACTDCFDDPYGQGASTTPRIGWVIVGGESGRDARPMHPGWARRIVRDCREVGVPVFVKQMGRWTVTADGDCDAVVDNTRMRRRGVREHGGDWDDGTWEPALRVREFPR